MKQGVHLPDKYSTSILPNNKDQFLCTQIPSNRSLVPFQGPQETHKEFLLLLWATLLPLRYLHQCDIQEGETYPHFPILCLEWCQVWSINGNINQLFLKVFLLISYNHQSGLTLKSCQVAESEERLRSFLEFLVEQLIVHMKMVYGLYWVYCCSVPISCTYLRYLDRLAQFSFKLVWMGVCINNDKARPQHWELYSLREMCGFVPC